MPSFQNTDANYSDSSIFDDSEDSSCSFPPFSPIVCSSATSHDLDELESIHLSDGHESFDSLDMLSPAPSVYSLTNSLREQSFRREYGRDINNHSEVYRLPADEEEIARLETQHHTFSLMMGPWVPPLPDVLAPEPGITKCVLDIGCGTGAWIKNVAREFPECSATGVDLTPIHTGILPNCRFEVDDVNLGLEHFYDSFDVVNASFISTGITDYSVLIDHMTRCLRTRGLIAVRDVDCSLYNLDKSLAAPWSQSLPIDDASYLSRWYFALVNAVRRQGAHIDAAPYFHMWIREHHSFAEEDIVHQEYWCPIGHNEAWGDIGSYSREVAEMMRADFIRVLPSGRPLLLGNGMHPEVLDLIEANAQRELEELREPLLLRYHLVYARKRATQ